MYPDWGCRATDTINLHPFAVFEAAFGHHQACPEQSRRVDVGFEAQVAAAGVQGVDYTDAEAGVELFQFADDPSTVLRAGLGCGLQQEL